MNRLVISTSLALAVTWGAAYAQQQTPDAQVPAPPPAAVPGGYGHHRQPDPQRQAAMLSRRLGLSADQTQKLEPILASRDQQMEALHSNTQMAPEDRHAQMRSIMQNTDQQLSGVLTPDQMTQYKEMRRHERHDHGQPGDVPAPAPGL